MDDRFFNGIIGAETEVCGAKLTHLSPWHLILLTAIENPLIVPDAKANRKDIILFLKVLDVSYPVIPNLSTRLVDEYWMWRLKNSKVFKAVVSELREWLSVQMSSPLLWVDEEKGQSGNLSSPVLLSLVIGLVSKCHIPLHQAWNMRIAECRWCDVAMAEMEGANLTVAYDDEAEPPVIDRSEAEIIAQAKHDLPPHIYEDWISQRQKCKRQQ